MAAQSFTFALALSGDAYVGKTAIALQFAYHDFKSVYTPSIGVDFFSTELSIKGKSITLQLWDIAGQEAFRGCALWVYQHVCGVVLIYDVANRDTFNTVGRRLQEIREAAKRSPVLFLVGNKCDEERSVSAEEGHALANELGVMFMEVSAKSLEQVKVMFESLCRAILEKIESSEYEISGVRIRLIE